MPTKAQKPAKSKKKAPRKKRRRKSRYHTGIHLSPKCKTPISYRSGWEKTICDYLDADPTVVAYSYEAIIINYVSNQKSQRQRKYLPDFLVVYKDGRMKMVEVKRQNMLTNLKVQQKAEAAKVWCANQIPPIQYEFWTDKVVLPLQKAAKLRSSVGKSK